jgi:hypothetical protein
MSVTSSVLRQDGNGDNRTRVLNRQRKFVHLHCIVPSFQVIVVHDSSLQDVTLRCWMSGSRRIERTYYLHFFFQGLCWPRFCCTVYIVMVNSTLENEGSSFFRNVGNYPKTQRHPSRTAQLSVVNFFGYWRPLYCGYIWSFVSLVNLNVCLFAAITCLLDGPRGKRLRRVTCPQREETLAALNERNGLDKMQSAEYHVACCRRDDGRLMKLLSMSNMKFVSSCFSRCLLPVYDLRTGVRVTRKWPLIELRIECRQCCPSVNILRRRLQSNTAWVSTSRMIM